jgi:Skp family chaperone for outer membrane proteins
MKFDKMGWFVAVGLLGCMVGMGFQGSSQKIGTVDLARVFNESDFAKSQDGSLKTMGASRKAILDFIAAYRAIPTEDAQKFRDLSLKPNGGATEKAELDRIRQAALATDQKFRDLQTKASPTDADRTQLNEFGRRANENMAFAQRLEQEFTEEIRQKQEGLRNETLKRAKAAVADVAAKQGYSVIFVEDVAPYSANDVTTEALKAMNAKK